MRPVPGIRSRHGGLAGNEHLQFGFAGPGLTGTIADEAEPSDDAEPTWSTPLMIHPPGPGIGFGEHHLEMRGSAAERLRGRGRAYGSFVCHCTCALAGTMFQFKSTALTVTGNEMPAAWLKCHRGLACRRSGQGAFTGHEHLQFDRAVG